MSDRTRPWRDYLETILVAIFLALVVRSFIVTGYKVPTSSMAPTLLPGDFIFAYRLPFGVKIPFFGSKLAVAPPERGQVVVFTYPEQPLVHYVKRVIGLPGDQVRIVQGELFVNDQKMIYRDLSTEVPDIGSPDYFKVVEEFDGESSRRLLVQKNKKSKSFGPIVVPPNEVFLLGDNRDTSDDSRYWGTVPVERIESKVILIWMSLDWTQKSLENKLPFVRWGRVMKSLN